MLALQIISFRNLRWILPLLIGFSLILPYLHVISSIVHTYYFWLSFSDLVQNASPQLTGLAEPNRPLVPKILHQTWVNSSIPPAWQDAMKSCQKQHSDYTYKLWTDDMATHLISTKFPWFLDTWMQYPHSIQRADALRYFVLYEYGGIYLDLDISCRSSLDFLRFYNFTAPKTYPIGLSNDVLASRPKDDFALFLINNLQAWDQRFVFKYATVMFSTGPMFVTVQYSRYERRDQVSVLASQLYGKYQKGPEALLEHLHGRTWHGEDAKYLLWVHKYYWIFILLLALTVVVRACLSCYRPRSHDILITTKSTRGSSQWGVIAV